MGPPIADSNALASDGAEGVTSPSATIDENHIRSSVHERLMAVAQSYSSKLQFATDTLATKVLLCQGAGGATRAYGVQIAPGAALPVSIPFGGKVSLNVKNVTARHEVIVSAGTFQSPQLVSKTRVLLAYPSLTTFGSVADGMPCFSSSHNT